MEPSTSLNMEDLYTEYKRINAEMIAEARTAKPPPEKNWSYGVTKYGRRRRKPLKERGPRKIKFDVTYLPASVKAKIAKPTFIDRDAPRPRGGSSSCFCREDDGCACGRWRGEQPE